MLDQIVGRLLGRGQPLWDDLMFLLPRSVGQNLGERQLGVDQDLAQLSPVSTLGSFDPCRRQLNGRYGLFHGPLVVARSGGGHQPAREVSGSSMVQCGQVRFFKHLSKFILSFGGLAQLPSRVGQSNLTGNRIRLEFQGFLGRFQGRQRSTTRQLQLGRQRIGRRIFGIQFLSRFQVGKPLPQVIERGLLSAQQKRFDRDRLQNHVFDQRRSSVGRSLGVREHQAPLGIHFSDRVLPFVQHECRPKRLPTPVLSRHPRACSAPPGRSQSTPRVRPSP